MREHNIVKKIYRDSTIKKIDKKIKLLGVNCKYDAINIMNIRVLVCMATFSVIIIFSKYGYFLAPIMAIGVWIIFESLVLDIQIKKRGNCLDKEAIFFFEVLVLSLESGQNIEGAIKVTVENVDGELSSEFKKCLEEVNVGKSLQESLNSMSLRIPSDSINNVILNISQSSLFGNNIVDTLYSQIDYLRTKRILLVRSNINKLPIKLSVVSVLFFVPIILIIILAPVIINLIG